MSFLPSGDLLVTQKTGELELLKLSGPQAGEKLTVSGTPKVAYGGQGGLGDVVVDPDFAQNSLIWLSYIQSSGGKYGAVVIKAKLETGEQPKLTQIQKIWEQTPLMSGQGHYSHRIAVGPAGTEHAGYVFITSGDRQEQTPAQNFTGNLGKVIRLKTDGSVPSDNPWQDKGDVARQFYSMGHRNLLGIDFDASGSLWSHEMGPRHGDELNRILAGENYGWPVVSNGDNYSGVPIPDHSTRPEFEKPKVFWVPAISPAGFSIYQGAIKDWQGSAFIGGLSSQALIEVSMSDTQEKQRYEWGSRVREVETGADGALWVLEDGSEARLLKLTPKSTS
jgi:glucose/arabinose dehydrogenase